VRATSRMATLEAVRAVVFVTESRACAGRRDVDQ
jgi:hypothetical protein